MPYSSLSAAKEAGFNTTLDGVALTLSQVNDIAAAYDSIKAEGGVEEPMAVAVASFRKSHTKTDNGWKAKTEESAPVTEKINIEESSPRLNHRTWYESASYELEEAEGEPSALKLRLISAGFSQNKDRMHKTRRGREYQRYYPIATLQEAVKLAEGLPIYTGNVRDHRGTRRLEDIAGYFKEARIEDGAIVGKLKPLGHKNWLLDLAREKPSAFGPSIEATGDCALAEAEGQAAAVVTKIDQIHAALLVENPAAGGGVAGFTESIEDEERGEQRMLKDLTEAEQAEVMAEARKLVESEMDVKAKDDEIKTLKESAEEKDAKIKELEEAANEAKSKDLIEAAMPKKDGNHVLPEIARNKLHESLKGEVDEKKITDAVKAEAEYISELVEAGKVTGNGGAKETSDDGKKTLEESADEVFGIKSEKKDGE